MNKKLDRFYKVCKRTKKAFYSTHAQGKARIRYFKNKFIGSPTWLNITGRHPTIFDNYDDAVHFAIHSGDKDSVVFEIRIRGLSPLKRMATMGPLEKGKIVFENNAEWPRGTCSAKEIKLHKEVWTPKSSYQPYF